MTRQEIIDECGFDPKNYDMKYYFHYYYIENDGFRFVDVNCIENKHNYITINDQYMYNGLFFQINESDLSYITNKRDKVPSFVPAVATQHV